MPLFAVRPDDLGDAAAVSGGEASSVQAAGRLVAFAASEGVGSLGTADSVLIAALEGYGHVESAVASTLSEAVAVLSRALTSGAAAYAGADSGEAVAFGSGYGGGP